MLPETHRAERGHDFYPPADVLAAIPELYGTEEIPNCEFALRRQTLHPSSS